MLGDEKLMAFIATADAERAKQFYRDLLGLRLLADEPFALVFDVRGTMLRVQKAEHVTVAPYTSLGWQVDDVAGVAEQLLQKGVRLERFPHMAQDALGVWTTPDGAKVAWFKDPDGNLLSLTEF
jgi:catechol 2,3-dioxygenase-like lactoylglutathione lyase family enzyme